jgi:hypothetical protein
MSSDGRTKAIRAVAGGLATLAGLGGGELYILNRGLPSLEGTAAGVSRVTASEIFAETAANRIISSVESPTISGAIGSKLSGGNLLPSYPPLGAIKNAPTSAKAWLPPVNAQSDPFAKLKPFPKAVDRPNPVPNQISPPRPIVVPNAILPPTQSISPSATADFLSRVQPKIVDHLISLRRPVSLDYANSIVRNDLVSAAQQAEKESAAKVSFEVLTGKIKIEASKTVGGVKISGGEINAYKVAGTIGAAVVACNAVADTHFKDCVADAAKKAIKNSLDGPKETETAGAK